MRHTYLILSLIFLSCIPTRAEDFNIANGDVNGLIQAMEQANTNPDSTNTIFLFPDGVYTLRQVYEVVQDGIVLGPVGLPSVIKLRGKTLIIEGNNATIIRDPNAPQFRLLLANQDSELTLRNLRLENGLINIVGGGGVYANLARLNIEGCTFVNNQTLIRFGGAVYVGLRSDARIVDTDFYDNKAYKHGGAIYNVLSNLDVDNCRFFRNTTSKPGGADASGGALMVDGGRLDPEGGGGSIRLVNSYFEENAAAVEGESAGGGGAYIFAYNDNDIFIDRCTFRNNWSRRYGGGFFFDGGPRNGQPNNITFLMSNCLFYDNTALETGGAIWMGSNEEAASARMENCTITENKARTGGGVHCNMSYFEFLNCTIARNEAQDGSSGGISGNQNMTLINCIIAYNRANNTFGILQNCRHRFQGHHNIQYPGLHPWHPNDNFCSDPITVIDPQIGPLRDNGGPNLSLALAPTSPAIDAGDNAFGPANDVRGVQRANVGAGSGTNKDIGSYEYTTLGVVVESPQNLVSSSAGLRQIDLTWVDNASNEIGFLIQRSIGNPFNFQDLDQVGENVETYSDINLELNTTYYYRVRARGGENEEWSNISSMITPTDGACIRPVSLPVSMDEVDIIVGDGSPESCTETALRTALSTGGKIFCNCGPDTLSIPITEELLVTETGTVLDGGGLVTLDAQHSSRILRVNEGIRFSLQNIRLINGRSASNGGAIQESGGAILVGNEVDGNGGGQLYLFNTTFENNAVSRPDQEGRNGGAVYAYRLQEFIVSESVFYLNSANSGGAIAVEGSQLEIYNTILDSNWAIGPEAFRSGKGGALFINGLDAWDPTLAQDHEFILCGTRVRANQSNSHGAGVYTTFADARRNSALIDRCTFERNQISASGNGQGGGIFFEEELSQGNTNDPANNLRVLASTFEGNIAQNLGGGIAAAADGTVLIANSTFYRNEVNKVTSALGGAIGFPLVSYSGNYWVNNSTIVQNISAHYAGGIYAAANQNLQITNTILSENESEFPFEGQQYSGLANLTGNANLQYPELNPWNNNPDVIVPGVISLLDPRLRVLANNGGPTQTIEIGLASDAVDNGDLNAASQDQRGLPPVNTRDIGAYESGAFISDVPVILDFEPSVAQLRDTITVTGYSFTGTNSVVVNTAAASTFFFLEDDSLRFIVPDLATTGNILLSNDFGIGTSRTELTINIPQPVINDLSIRRGRAGDTVLITGENFLGAQEVIFNDGLTIQFEVLDANTIQVIVPENATNGLVQVRTGGGLEYGPFFEVIPELRGFDPMVAGRGSTIIISGVNLVNSYSVDMLATPAERFNVENSTSIRAVVSDTSPFGLGKVSIFAGDSLEYISVDTLEIIPPPRIDQFYPDSGRVGDLVTIVGQYFTYTKEVSLNSRLVGGFEVISDDTLQFQVPRNGTTGRIFFQSPGGEDDTRGLLLENFTVIPSLEDFSPRVVGAGTSVKIVGTNFIGVDEANKVLFGVDTAQAINFQNSTELDAIMPSLGDTIIKVPITLLATDGDAVSLDSITFVPPPVIDSVSPGMGGLGTEITIYGKFFLELSSVRFGTSSQTVFEVNDTGTEITLLVPPQARNGFIEVEAVGGMGTSPNSFTVIPSIRDFSPDRAGTGADITINGANFETSSNIEVFFGITPASNIEVLSPTRVRATVGNGSSGEIRVVNNADLVQSDTSSALFEYVPAPVISDFNPKADNEGGLITLIGQNYLPGETEVRLNGVQISGVNVISATELNFTIPQGGRSGKIEVRTLGGRDESTDDLIVLPPPPVVNSSSPGNGPVGTRISVNGLNLVEILSITFFDTIPATYTENSSTNLTVIVPLSAPLATGTIRITTRGGTVDIPNFTVEPTLPPVLTSLTPEEGRPGTWLTIVGEHLIATLDVKFPALVDSISATDVIIRNTRRILVRIPEGAVSGNFTLFNPASSVLSPERVNIPYVWRNPVDDDWSNPLNWIPEAVPNNRDIDVIIEQTAFDPILTGGISSQVRDLDLEDFTSLTVDSTDTLQIAGIFLGPGTTDFKGTVVYNGDTLQEINGHIGSFRNLVIDNPGGISMRRTLPVRNILRFENGNLNLNKEIIFLGRTGRVENEAEGQAITGGPGYIEAEISIKDSLSNGINVGNLGARVTIGNVSDVNSLRVRRGHIRQGITNLGIDRYYDIHINGVNDDLDATLELKYLDTELQGYQEDKLSMYRFTGSDWDPYFPDEVDIVQNWVRRDSIPQFSVWTLGQFDLPLPLELQSFLARRQSETSILLSWSIEQESGVAYYEIQKSLNGIQFESLLQLPPVSRLEANRRTSTYTYEDQPEPDAVYYRIKILKDDGEINYSPVRFVPPFGREHFIAYPNPSIRQQKVSLSRVPGSDLSEDLSLRLFRGDGRSLAAWEGDIAEVNRVLAERLEQEPAGLYVLLIQSSTGMQVLKIIRE